MIDNSWVMDVESRIFTQIKGRVYEKLSVKFPDIFLTTNDELAENTTKKYTVFIDELEPVETGKTLEGITINAELSTFQVRITTLTKKEDCRIICKYIIDAFKDLGYDVVMIPTIKTVDGKHIGIGRFRRMLGALDKL